MLAGEDINILIAPRVLRDCGLEIRAVPFGILIDILDQSTEPHCGVRITAYIQPETGQRLLQKLDLGLGGADIRLLDVVQIQRRRNGRQCDQNNDHDDDFYQGEVRSFPSSFSHILGPP